MKNLRICSDLHLEQWYGKKIKYLCDTLLPVDMCDSDSVLVLAGDISSQPAQLHEFLDECLSRFQKVIYVSGNHEYYGHVLTDWERNFHAWAQGKPNLFVGTAKMQCVEIDGTRFILGTLWADGGKCPIDELLVQKGLRDFYVIKNENGTIFRVNDMKKLHAVQKQQLTTWLNEPFAGRTVVVSHHMPSYSLCHPRFGGEINGGFAADCDELLHSGKIDLWIHGHTHDTICQKVGETLVMCNPSGYEMERFSPFNQFRPVFIELSTLRMA